MKLMRGIPITHSSVPTTFNPAQIISTNRDKTCPNVTIVVTAQPLCPDDLGYYEVALPQEEFDARWEAALSEVSTRPTTVPLVHVLLDRGEDFFLAGIPIYSFLHGMGFSLRRTDPKLSGTSWSFAVRGEGHNAWFRTISSLIPHLRTQLRTEPLIGVEVITEMEKRIETKETP